MINKLFGVICTRLLIQGRAKQHIRFCLAKSEAELQHIAAFRLQQYQRRLPYMLQALDLEGKDEFDSRSQHFYLKKHDEILAVVRFSPAPFELEKLYCQAEISQAIGAKKLAKTLEISRLIVTDQTGYKGLMPALLLYSSVYLLFYSSYRYYISYCKASNAEKFKGFRRLEANAEFQIKARGEQPYLLYFGHLQGAMLQGLMNALRRKLKAKRITA